MNFYIYLFLKGMIVYMEHTEENQEKEPLFRVVIPKRRSWFYSLKYYIRGLKAIQALLGPQVKALPAPSKFRL